MTLVRCVSGEAPEDSDLGRAATRSPEASRTGGFGIGTRSRCSRGTVGRTSRRCAIREASRGSRRRARGSPGWCVRRRYDARRTRGCLGNRPPPRLIFAKVASARRGSSRAPRRRPRSRRRRRRNSARDEDGRRRARRRSRRTRGYLAGLTRIRRRRTGARTREATATRKTTPRSTRTTPTSRGSETRDRREPSHPSMTTRRRGIAT